MTSIDLLGRLIGFPTVSRDSNLALIQFVVDLLNAHEIESTLMRSVDGHKANLFATIGPRDRPGIMLSGHSDVVPVEGQDWSVPPFTLTKRAGNLYGRGAADMKGFIACALSAALKASRMELVTPLHIAISHDEEIGCIGVRSLIETLQQAPHRPLLCIVGEPTGMQVATGHKGKLAAKAICTGREGHSALAPLALNAIHLAADFVSALRDIQARLQRDGAQDADYDIAYTTVHVGKIAGGVALNIVPNRCEIDFEIRNVDADDPLEIMNAIREQAARLVSRHIGDFPEASVEIEIVNSYPGLDTPASAQAVSFVKALTGGNSTMKVAFGTEGGLFTRDLGTPTVICGPGSMAQGHKPDEYVSVEQMQRCDAMLGRLLERLCEPSIGI